MSEGTIWRVGDGKEIDIWDDAWVGDGEGRFITSDRVEGLSRVSDLIEDGRKEWKVDLI